MIDPNWTPRPNQWSDTGGAFADGSGKWSADRVLRWIHGDQTYTVWQGVSGTRNGNPYDSDFVARREGPDGIRWAGLPGHDQPLFPPVTLAPAQPETPVRGPVGSTGEGVLGMGTSSAPTQVPPQATPPASTPPVTKPLFSPGDSGADPWRIRLPGQTPGADGCLDGL